MKPIIVDFTYIHEYSDEEDLGEYNCICEVFVEEEMDYGADADGNRGERRLFVNEVRVISVYDDSGDPLSVEDFSTSFINCIKEEAVDKFHGR